MADKAPLHPSQPDDQNNVLVYSVASELAGNGSAALQTSVSGATKPCTTAVYYQHHPGAGPGVVESVSSSAPGLVASPHGALQNSVPGLVASVDSGYNVPVDHCVSSKDNGHDTSDYKIEAVAPPFGWKRILSNGIIIYLSPSNTALSSLDQVKGYVQSEGTCKCGLECPLHLALAFNFDPKVVTKPYSPTVIAPGDLTKLCNHKRKLLANVEAVPADSRFGGVEALRRKKRRVVVTGSPGQVMIGNSQMIGPGGAVMQQASVGMYPGVNQQSMSLAQGTTLQPGSTLHQGAPLQAPAHSPCVNLPQGVNLPHGTTIQPGPVGMHPSQPQPIANTTVPPADPALMQQSIDMQPTPQSMILQHDPTLSMQQNVASSLALQPNGPPPLQQNPVVQQPSSVVPSPAASPALSSNSLPPPSPLSTRMTPPIVPSSSRSDINNPQFVKVHQQIPGHDVWREGGYPNGFLDYMNSTGVVPQSPSPCPDTALIHQHGVQSSPSPDLSSSMPGQASIRGEDVQSLFAQSQMLSQGLVQSNSPVPQQGGVSIVPPSSQVLTQVVQSPGPEMSVSVAHCSIPVQQVNQPTMVRRFPLHMSSQSPSQPPQSTYQINQPVQIQYDNSRVCPPGYSIKYSKKTNNQVQHQIVEDQQVAVSHAQSLNSYQNSMQSSQQQVVSISSQQHNSSAHHHHHHQVINTQHHTDQTSVALQHNLHSVVASKTHGSTNSHEIAAGSMARVRTPPWHQNKHHTQPTEKTWSRKSKLKDEAVPSFLEDPSGYLAQQTAMLRQVVAGREDEEGPKTMASGHTASSNTLTSVLAGRTNTLTVSVGSQEPKPPQQHILVSSGNGQFIIAAAPKVNPPSPLLLPAPLLLQPIDTVQLPQLVVPPTIHEETVEKRKSPNKKRKLSPTTTTTTMLLSPQPQQQVLTILPSKSPLANMIQPLNVVQNFPIQQFLVPSMVMSDGTILQDTVQVNLLPGAGVFSSGQNLLTPASVVLRAPTTTQHQPPQPPKFIHSPNQFVNFGGDLSSQVVPTTTNTTVVQQNTTTIVQQTTMVQQPSPSYILENKPNFILTPDKNNYILNTADGNGSEKSGRLAGGYVRNSVSTQTQNQMVQVSSSGGLMVRTGSSRGGSPPDTTTLSPADQEVTTSVTSPDPSMVHCVSSSNLHDDSSPYQIDTTTSSIPYHTGNSGKPVSYDESSYLHQPLQDKDITQMNSDDSTGKMLCTTTSNGSPLDTLEGSDGLVN